MTRAARRYFTAASEAERGQLTVVAVAVAAFLVHYALYSWWFIEDAAITFAYARQLVLGDGLVAYPGGERVEGFSNPTWTLLLAGFDLVGINPWIASKLLGALFGALTVVFTWRWARRVVPEGSAWAALAPVILACNPQFVAWNASGLENPVFAVLLAFGGWQLLREVEEDGPPISGLAFFLLAITRPEAPMYAAIAGAAGLVLVAGQRGRRAAWRWAWQWGLLAGAPFLAWHAWRIDYFAWPFPNTYYAKLGESDRFLPFSWGKKGWHYLRGYALDTTQGFLLPVYALAMTGLRGGRGAAGVAVAMGAALLVLPGVGTTWRDLLGSDEPQALVVARVAALAGAAALLPLIGLGRPGWQARSLAWAFGGAAVFFALYSGGDWMVGYRWLHHAAVPMAVLLAEGARAFIEEVEWPERLGPWPARLLSAWGPVAGLVYSGWLLGNADTMPYDVHRRVRYMQLAQERLHLDQVTLMEVDMGAHLWWTDWEVVDIAGLVDVPMGHHNFEKPFNEHYAYEERRPDFVHLHGHWANRSKLDRPKAFSQRYVEIPGFPSSPRSFHTGNHVRRDHFLPTRWEAPDRASWPLAPAGEPAALRLEGLHLPAPAVAPGQALYLELGLRKLADLPALRAYAFLASGERLWVQELPLGYDWVMPQDWKSTEVFHGRFTLELPADWPEGASDLGLALVDAEGRVWTHEKAAESPRFVRGELRWDGRVQVVSEAKLRERALADVAAAEVAAEAADCPLARSRFEAARRAYRVADPDRVALDARGKAAMARCHAALASAETDPVRAAGHLYDGRRWAPREPTLAAAGARLAPPMAEAGRAAEAAGDHRRAYELLNAAVLADPTRAWDRRAAEAARDRMLQIREGAP